MQTPITKTGLLDEGVTAALFAPAARLYERVATFGTLNDCVACATTADVIKATATATVNIAGRENFWMSIFIELFFVE